jgi:hypothetical protein
VDFGRATRGCWRPPTPQKSASGSQDPHLPTLLRILWSAIIITPPWQTNRAQGAPDWLRQAGFWLFPKGWVSKVLIFPICLAGVVGGGQIGAESGRASRCMQQGGWVGGTLSFCICTAVR